VEAGDDLGEGFASVPFLDEAYETCQYEVESTDQRQCGAGGPEPYERNADGEVPEDGVELRRVDPLPLQARKRNP